MKLFTKFLQRIADVIPLAGVPLDRLARLDPDRVYLENVRSLLEVSTFSAKLVCETAVRRGIFIRRTSLICPDGSVAWTGGPEDDPPATLRCWHETEYGPEPEAIARESLRREEFFVLNER